MDCSLEHVRSRAGREQPRTSPSLGQCFSVLVVQHQIAISQLYLELLESLPRTLYAKLNPPVPGSSTIKSIGESNPTPLQSC